MRKVMKKIDFNRETEYLRNDYEGAPLRDSDEW